MAVPRIFFVPVVGLGGTHAPTVAWRLVGGNNHDLGRSGRSYADLDAAHDAVVTLRDALSVVKPVVSPGRRPGGWCWELQLDGLPAAISSRPYERQRDCVANLGYFMSALPAARVADELAVLPVRREILHPEYRIEPVPADPAEDELAFPGGAAAAAGAP